MKKILESNYHIFPEKKLMLEYVQGIITPGSLINLKKIELSDKDFNPFYNVIGDVRNTTFDIATSQVEVFVNYIIKNKDAFEVNKTAIIFSSANQKIYIDILNSFKDQYPHSLKICSSLQEAINFVERKDDSIFIEKAFEQLQKELPIKWEFESDY